MVERFLAPGSPGRRAALTVAAVVGALVFTQFVLPAPTGGGRGTPTAILFSGLVNGMVQALTAAGIVLIYRTNRVINWAQTAIGAAGATLVFDFVRFTPGVPFLAALALGLVLAGLTGLLFELILVRRFFRSPRLILTVVTILGAGAVSTLSPNVGRLPFFPKVEELSITDLAGVESLRNDLPFAGFTFHVGDLNIPFGFPELLALEASVLALLGLAVFFRYTRAGVGVRAMAENLERSALLGMSVGALSSLVWTLAGVLSGVSASLTGFLNRPVDGAGFAPGVLLVALAAAVIGRMRSLPVTVAAAVVISVLSRATAYALPEDGALVNVGLLGVILAALLLQRRAAGRTDEDATESWQAAAEQRPVPKELRRVPSVRVAAVVLAVLGLAAVALFPFLVPIRLINLGGVIALSTITLLSLVVLTGWAGQVSLGQYAFTAVGAVMGGSLSERVGIPFWFAVPLAAAVTGGFAALIGLPALRIRGLFLAVTTFALAFAAQAALFNDRYFGWLLPENREVERPTLFFLDFHDEKSMYFLCVAALVATLVLLANLRRSRFGRLLIAVRDNEANVRALGVSPVRLKLLAFAVSGAIAGFGGAVFAHQQQGLNPVSFGADASVQIFVLAVLGGITSSSGALLGSGYGNLVQYYLQNNVVVAALLGYGGPLFLIYLVPGGLVSVLTKLRDSVLRIIAQRRQLVVPSLFADYDPEALEARLVQLGERSDDSGLAALSSAQRYTLRSELYRGEGERVIDRLAPKRATREAAVLTAAAEGAEADGDEISRSSS